MGDRALLYRAVPVPVEPPVGETEGDVDVPGEVVVL